ncbi:integrase/recombinase XerD [Ureibacillus xyleni]|uniref:Integrase/recombinase XerD n=1 Tax=Ureibacillus xyleni TaxID=614648 RepID=A0A285R8J8_9BACL|nr:tyrosine-type recombinase/integrase [Ureibacillus xyleni]SOB90420.1 integrase/recombinase XerD [Ureibacillus xyleni]
MNELLSSFENYLKQEEKSIHTISSYLTSVQKYFGWFEGVFGRPPQILHSENILSYKEELKKERNPKGEYISAKTINVRLNALRTFNKFLVEEGIMSDIIIGKNSYIKVQNLIVSPAKFTKQDVNHFFQSILESNEENQKDCYRNYTLAKLLALTGCRITEALSIQIEDIHLQAKEILIRNGKGAKSRTILVNSQLHRILTKYLNDIRPEYRLSQVSPYLFLSNRSHSLSRKTVNKMFAKYSKSAGLNEVLSPHDFRHYFCSQSLQNGLGIHETAALAGHSSIATTSLYTNVDRQTMLDKLENL